MFAQPTAAPNGPIPLDDNNQAFYNFLVTLCAFIQRTYGLFAFPVWTQIATPGLNSSNPEQVDYFFVVCPQLQGKVYVSQQDRFIFTGQDQNPSIKDLAAITLAQMTWPNPAPQPITIAPVVVVPQPPTNPIGDSFEDVGEVDFVDLGSPTIAIGGLYTAANGTIYVKKGRRTPFGMQTWWTLAPKPVPVVAEDQPTQKA